MCPDILTITCQLKTSHFHHFTSLVVHVFPSVLLRLGNRKASSLGMTLSSVVDQVAKLPLPHTKEQEEDDVFMLCRCCTDLTNFVRPFVNEARQNTLNGREQNETKVAGEQDGGKENELQTELLKL